MLSRDMIVKRCPDLDSHIPINCTALHLDTTDCITLHCIALYCTVTSIYLLYPIALNWTDLFRSGLDYFVGEGTQHVLKVAVTGAPSDIFARDLGRFVTNSNLVKCAMAGCDPNVGRIVGTFRYMQSLKRSFAADRLLESMSVFIRCNSVIPSIIIRWWWRTHSLHLKI